MSLEASYERVFRLDSSSFQLRLDVIDVLADIRPSARIIVEKGAEARKCVETLLFEHLEICVGSSCLISPGILQFADHHCISDQGKQCNFVRLYVSKERGRAEATKAADELAQDSALGAELGYPGCCIHAVRKRGAVPKILESLRLYSAGGRYDPYAWPVAHLYDAGLIPHFPCSMSCQDTHRIAQARLRLMISVDSIYQTQFWRRFASLNTMVYPAEVDAYPWNRQKELGSYTPLAPLYRLEVAV
ncbi:MAG: hypothetical protein JWP57_4134 [Spirosoma sp.]|nr:hypothetical protein [Spirosoma sp.]